MFNRKSQTAIEFITLIGLMSLTAIFFMAITIDQAKDFYNQREYIMIKDVALKAQSEIYIAASAKDGYLRNFEIPDLLEGSINYSIIIEDNKTLAVYSDRYTYFSSIPALKGNFSKKTNVIKKENGIIHLN